MTTVIVTTQAELDAALSDSAVLVPGMAAWHTDPSTPTGEPATEYAPPATVDPIVSSEGVTYPQSSDTKADAADYDPRHDKN